MRTRLLQRLLGLALDTPGRVLLGAAALTVVAALLVPGLRVEAGHRSLSAPDNPHITRLERFLDRFGSPNQLVVLVRGGSKELRRGLVDRLSDSLPAPSGDADRTPPCRPEEGANAPGCVGGVIGRIDLADLAAHALLYLDPDRLEPIVEALDSEALGVDALEATRDLPSLFRTLASGLRARSDEATGEGDRAEQATQGLTRLLDELERRMREPARMETDLARALMRDAELDTSRLRGIDRDGYLVSRDERMNLLLVRPVHESDSPEKVLPFVDYVRDRTTRAAERLSDEACSDGGCPGGRLEVTFTGLPALVADETEVLNRDVAVTSLGALLGIAILFSIGFRSLRSALLGLAPLVLATVWTLAFVRVTFESLNLVTASFLATILGLGIDFAVHVLARYQEARQTGDEPRAAITKAIEGAGPGVLTGGLTTAGAFFALLICQFQAFAELGIMTGFGLLVALAATVLVLPSLLVLPASRKMGLVPRPPSSRGDPEARERRGRRIGEMVVAHPVPLLLVGATVGVWMSVQGQQLTWNYDYTALLPAGLPSVQAWKELDEETAHSAQVAAIVAEDVEEAEKLASRLERKSSIERVEGIHALMPTNQEAKLRILERLRPRLDPPEQVEATSEPPERTAVVEAVRELGDTLQDLRFEALTGNEKAKAELLAEPLEATKSLRKTVEGLDDDETARRLTRLQKQVVELRDRFLEALRNGASGTRLQPDELLAALPDALRQRFSHEGRYALYVYPSGAVGERSFRKEFVTDLREADPDATGFPVTQWESLENIQMGLRQASGLTLVAVALLLFVDLRRVGQVLLALLPLGMGLLWTWGGMSVLGLHYNAANVIGFPLLVGIGVDAGVHILHRHHQELGPEVGGPRDDAHHVVEVVRHTGRAIFLSTGTTMIAFGSLALGQHQGVSSLGTVLLLGVGACLVSSTLFVPAVLTLLHRLRVRRHRRRATPTADPDV